MSSSTSSSEASALGFLRCFAWMATFAGLLTAVLLLLLDPYDSGRLTPLSRPGVQETGPRTASASRVRDPAFNGAIIGNSTIQLLSPERLKKLTGVDFVQLSVPGTGPMEQAALAERLFAIRGQSVGVLIIGLDDSWCDASRETRTIHPFPFWLHQSSDVGYAGSLFRWSSVEFLPGRIQNLLGSGRVARRDGYWDYEQRSPGLRLDSGLLGSATPARVAHAAPATAALRRIAAAAPARTRLILVNPPVHIAPASAAAPEERSAIETCKTALRAALDRADSAVVDYRIDDAAARDPGLFVDPLHYRRPFAERIEAAIATVLGKPM